MAKSTMLAALCGIGGGSRCIFQSAFISALLVGLFLTAATTSPAYAKYASIVVNARTGKVLQETNADSRHYPASLTKMMTLYLVFEALRDKRLTMDTDITISARAARQPASKLGFRPGDTIKLHDAILAVIVHSANDVATALGERLGGTERKFARLMNDRARKIGMTHTSFRNASGLPNRHQLTTARDLTHLVRALQTDFPEYYKLFATRTFTWHGRKMDNHNRLLDHYQGMDGVKTGYIHASGFNLASSATREGVRLIAVVLGARSPRTRDLHMMGLLERGFETATNGQYIAYDYDRNIKVGRHVRGDVPVSKARRARGARGRMALARLTPPRRPPELMNIVAEGSSPNPEIPTTPEHKALDWGIQVGAFSRFAPAHLTATRAMRRLPSLLAQTRVHIDRSREGRTLVYRAQLLGLDSERAERACGLLKTKQIPCLTVAPEITESANAAR